MPKAEGRGSLRAAYKVFLVPLDETGRRIGEVSAGLGSEARTASLLSSVA